MTDAPTTTGKGKKFFDRADQVSETGNWDFAIEMYLEGIRREPEELERGHKALRKAALNRKAQGGKPVGMLDAIKLRPTKDPVESLVNASHLLAKEPGNVTHMVAVMKAAQQAELPEVTRWIGEIILEAERQAKKPNKRVLVVAAESFGAIEEYSLATQAADMAAKIDPNDNKVAQMAKDFSTMATIKQGKYDKDGKFTESVKDMDKQLELSQRDQMVQSRDFIEQEIERARADYEDRPEKPGLVDGLVDALLKVEEEAYENQAIDVLKKAYADTKAYRFKSRMDDILIRQKRRRYNELRNEGRKEEATEQAKDLLAFELRVFADRAANYPTDLSIKFELGRRQLTAGQIDEAIASLQQAQRDPKRRIQALTYLGQAFSRKGWHREAVETYERALEHEPGEARAKDLHYYLGLELKEMDEIDKALDHFSEVAQLDYNYRDVRDQIEELRKKQG
jgi:TolA-binding protein